MPKNSVKHGTNADVFGGVDGQHVCTESNTAGHPWKSGCCHTEIENKQTNVNDDLKKKITNVNDLRKKQKDALILRFQTK